MKKQIEKGEFLGIIRERIDKQLPDEFWEAQYDKLESKTPSDVYAETPQLAVRAVAERFLRKEKKK